MAEDTGPTTDAAPATAADDGPSPFAGLLWTRGDVTSWLPPLRRLLGLAGLTRVVVAVDGSATTHLLPDDERVEVVVTGGFGATVEALARTADSPVLVMTAPTMLPDLDLEPALRILADDLRIASVSFFCNAAGHLSFPDRNVQNQFAVQGYDETTMSRLLRERGPHLLPVPIAAPAGPVTLLSRDAVVVTGGPVAELDGEPEVSVVELVLRAARRGLRSTLDPTTYVTRIWEGNHWGPAPLTEDVHRQRLHELHPFFPVLHDHERTADDVPLAYAFTSARAKVHGLRIIIDASALGPIENGTQVQTLALVEALTRRDDVRWVGVGLHGPVPRYAEQVLSHTKVSVLTMSDHRLRGAPQADILHRPFQPSGGLPWQNWHKAADRVVVTLQDLIAYSIGAYHDDGAAWRRYRRGIKQSVVKADGVVVISHDVAADLRRERLPVVDERTFVVENGTDHLTGQEAGTFPAELVARGWAAREFLVVLGANYTHKNRDLAVRTWQLLREQHPSLGLVLAGVAVAEGSSRVTEVEAIDGSDGVAVLPDVTSEERNWLLRHASLCLYPTSGEGFGLVPFESARFGTPTVHAGFGPLAEVLDEVPVAADSFDPVAFARCAEQLLGDPALAAEQVAATLRCGERYTWDRTAEQLVRAYSELLARPVR